MLDWLWYAESDTASGWQTARTIGNAATRQPRDTPTIWELEQDALPAMEHTPADAGKLIRIDGATATGTLPLVIPPHTHRTLLLDHAVLQTAYPELTLSGGKDASIKLTYSEALYDAQGKKGNRNEVDGRHIEGITDVLVADGGSKRVYAPLWWRTWRYLQIDVSSEEEPLTIDNLAAWFTAYPFVEHARLQASIPQLEGLWQNGWRTARLCAHETYMDAPYWEQLQYVGDTRIQALISYAMSGDTRLARQAITNIDHSRTSEGITQSRSPSELPQFIPTFSLLWIGMVHDYSLYADDAQLLRDVTPHTRTVIDWFSNHLRQDDLLGKMPWWEFADWTAQYTAGVPPQDADGGSTLLTLQFIAALRDAAELEEHYGSQDVAARYIAQANRSTEALRAKNWNAATGLFNDTPSLHSPSKDANILAVLLDVAPQNAQHQILAKLIGKDNTAPQMSEPSYYFRFYLARALEHAGMGDEYLQQLTPWRTMLDLGLSTWAENPEPARSDCHAWSASPNYDLLTLVAGIHSADQGFHRVRIEPHLGTLHALTASMPHPRGKIDVHYSYDGSAWQATVTLPEEITGSLQWKGKSYPLHAGTQSLVLP